MKLYLEGWAPGTLKNYNYELRRLVDYCRRKRWNCLFLSVGKMAKYLYSCSRRGMTVAGLSKLSAVMGFLCDITGYPNPFESKIITMINKAPALTIDQFRKIVNSCYDSDPAKIPLSRRYFLVMSVLPYWSD